MKMKITPMPLNSFGIVCSVHCENWLKLIFRHHRHCDIELCKHLHAHFWIGRQTFYCCLSSILAQCAVQLPIGENVCWFKQFVKNVCVTTIQYKQEEPNQSGLNRKFTESRDLPKHQIRSISFYLFVWERERESERVMTKIDTAHLYGRLVVSLEMFFFFIFD